jgi:hypothetical protein
VIGMTAIGSSRPRPGSREAIADFAAAVDRLLGPDDDTAPPPFADRYQVTALTDRGPVRISVSRNSTVVIADPENGSRIELGRSSLPELTDALVQIQRYLGLRR